MRLPLDWLSEWVSLPDDAELCERLEMAGFEDVLVEASGPELAGLVVGRVISREPHPNADRLSLCRVEAGGAEPVEVVCGAPNVAAEQKIAFAPTGSRLPDGTKLKRSKIRGVVSNGMICSARELGLGEDHSGILVLDPGLPVGTPLAEALGAGQRVLDLTLTPNRGDAASLLGIAREVRALFGSELCWPELEPAESGAPSAESIRVSIEAEADCFSYAARVVRGVRVGPSPDWLVKRLEAAGVRAINNVVDVTNLVLLELGQPLHGFDLSRIGGAEIRVRRARAGEKLATLDGQTRSLDPEDLVIADASRPVALAGVMGGAESEVGDATTDVLLESAHFHPSRVRRSARRHGLHTEASYRFERGVDREGIVRAADRAARLLAELAGGAAAPGVVLARGSAPEPLAEIRLQVARVERILGIELSLDACLELLGRLGIDCRREGDGLVATPPSHRNDLRRPEDLIEEIARIHGYDRIPTTYPVAPLAPVELPWAWRLAEQTRDALAGAGLTECVSFPFVSAEDLEALRIPAEDPRRAQLRLANPVREEEPLLRSTLVASLLRIARQNRARQVDRIRIFEVARRFLPEPGGGLPRELLGVAAVVTQGEERRLWDAREPTPLFYQAKGIAKTLMVQMGYPARFEALPAAGAEPYVHPGAAAVVEVGGRGVGVVGELHPEVASRFELDVPTALIEIDLSQLDEAERESRRFREVSRQPLVRRDLALLVPREAAAGELLAAARQAGGRDLLSVEVFDRYEGRGVPDGRVSLAFRLVFQRADRTLTDEEVSGRVDRIVELLARRFDAKLR